MSGRAPKPTTADWRLEDHLCLACSGRLLSRKPAKSRTHDRVYRCSQCGVSGVGEARSICHCGSKYGGRLAGLRCVVNDAPTPEQPYEIVVKEVA